MLKKQMWPGSRTASVLLALLGLLAIGHSASGSDDVILSVKASPLACEFFYQSPHGRAKSLDDAPTRDLSSESLTDEKHFNYNFTGIFVGLYATGTGQKNTTPADFDWFEYHATEK